MGCHDNIYKLFDLNDDLCISFLLVNRVHHSAKTTWLMVVVQSNNNNNKKSDFQPDMDRACIEQW